MGNGMNKVLPGVYIGNFRDSKDPEQLRANNITHIISIHDTARKLHEDKEYLCIQASDTPGQNLTQFFSQSNDFIHSARFNGGNVLIHCLAGVSRSVTIAVAYVMSVTSLSWREALKAVRGARSIANPNFGFQKQLHEFECKKLYEERKRLRQKFSRESFYDDEQECRKLLVAYHNSVRPLEPCASICRRGPGLTPPSSPRRRRRSPSPSTSGSSHGTSSYSRPP
ncbi:dual specificity protein phosphatase 22-B-like [Ornithodoros turicata]|uniref:dual specificity protein phosphatase 22-B-like n=1 Tax=Ornithodoros turicata TaxID=34597 RepID=UPI003138EF32